MIIGISKDADNRKIKPIAVGLIIRRIIGRRLSSRVTPEATLRTYFQPLQVAIGTRGATESIIHATKETIRRMNTEETNNTTQFAVIQIRCQERLQLYRSIAYVNSMHYSCPRHNTVGLLLRESTINLLWAPVGDPKASERLIRDRLEDTKRIWETLIEQQDPQMSYHIQRMCAIASKNLYSLRFTPPLTTVSVAKKFDVGMRKVFEEFTGDKQIGLGRKRLCRPNQGVSVWSYAFHSQELHISAQS